MVTVFIDESDTVEAVPPLAERGAAAERCVPHSQQLSRGLATTMALHCQARKSWGHMFGQRVKLG
jgi:hypothetical protein